MITGVSRRLLSTQSWTSASRRGCLSRAPIGTSGEAQLETKVLLTWGSIEVKAMGGRALACIRTFSGGARVGARQIRSKAPQSLWLSALSPFPSGGQGRLLRVFQGSIKNSQKENDWCCGDSQAQLDLFADTAAMPAGHRMPGAAAFVADSASKPADATTAGDVVAGGPEMRDMAELTRAVAARASSSAPRG